MATVNDKTTGEPDVGPLTRDVSAWPGAPGVPGGVKLAGAGPVAQSVVGDNDYLSGGADTVSQAQAFPGYAGQTWQAFQPGDDLAGDEPVMGLEASGHVSGGIRVSHPEAFPGGGQGV